jgi:GTP:adenosylcobinamide-phosphate guanylyltransferase
MHAIVTAGGIPTPKDPLYAYTRGIPKALLSVAGKPMIQWVIDALNGSDAISNVIITGLPPFTEINSTHPLTILPSQGDIVNNIRAGVDEIRRTNPGAEKTLVISSDIPSIHPDMVNWMTKTVEDTDADIYYNVISRQVMESTFPGSKRTYTRFKDVEVCGGDLNAIRLSLVTDDNPFFHQIIDSRKNPFKQAFLFGFDILFLLLLNQLTLRDAEKKASERLGAKGSVILCPYAQLGMDIDKPNQFEMVQTYMKKQLSR